MTLEMVTAAAGLGVADTRRRTADRIFRGALMFNAALTVYWVVVAVTGRGTMFFPHYAIDSGTAGRLAGGIGVFYVLWGFIWYAIKGVLLRRFVGFSKAEVRLAYSSRMNAPFDVAAFTSRYSERRIRIADMIGRRGRFITLAAAGFYYLYTQVASNPSKDFAVLFLQDNLFDAVITNWVFLAFYYANGFLAAAFYGPQSRVMDGVLARANCLLITTLWAAFKFIMVPLGGQLAAVFPVGAFAAVFALIWGSYLVTDAMSEVGGALFGRQTIRVRGIGDVNRKSIAGTVTGFVSCLTLGVLVVSAHQLGPAWLGLVLVLSVVNTLLELFSPRGTDDFVMATANAAICLAFGSFVL
jgi:hypothetical protein